MSVKPLPTSFEIFKIISQNIETISDVFDKKSSHFEELRDIVCSSKKLTEMDRFLSSSDAITYIQVLMVAGLSMYGGLFIPSIKHVRYKKKKFYLTWATGLTDQFEFGKITKGFNHFISSYQKKILSKRKGIEDLYPTIIPVIKQHLESYCDTLTYTDNMVQELMSNNIEELMGTDMTQEDLFILFSSFPSDEMNALFLYVYQNLPEDICMKIGPGKTMNLSLLFETPTPDLSYLVEKTRIYFDLYYSQHLPILRDITRMKTNEFVHAMMKNKKVKTTVLNNLKLLRENQIKSRLQLYRVFIQHIKILLK